MSQETKLLPRARIFYLVEFYAMNAYEGIGPLEYDLPS
jgi:hypothetical protein